MGRRKEVPAPSCPRGHGDASVVAYGTRESAKGLVQRFRCTPKSGSETPRHIFDVLVAPADEKAIPLVERTDTATACTREADYASGPTGRGSRAL